MYQSKLRLLLSQSSAESINYLTVSFPGWHYFFYCDGIKSLKKAAGVRFFGLLSAWWLVAEEADKQGHGSACCLRIILSDMLRTKRADLHILVLHSSDPETTRWTGSSRWASRQTKTLGGERTQLPRLMCPGSTAAHAGSTETYGKKTGKTKYLFYEVQNHENE